MWTLLKALTLIRGTQETAKGYGYHICLGGGVLNKGVSNKDLDLYFIPLINDGMDPKGLVQSLEIGWGPSSGEAESWSDPTRHDPFSHKLRFTGSKPSDAFIGQIDVFIIR